MFKIVIIDDDRVNLLLAKKFLSSDYETVTFSSPNEGLQYLKENTPDLILLDIQMPELDGFQLLSELKKVPVKAQIPVIFLTADRSERTEAECFKVGAVDYVSKPFVPEIMLQRIKRCLELEDYRKKLEQMVELQLFRITQLQTDIIFTMANLIESRDGTTGEHVRRTADYVGFLTKKLKAKGLYSEYLSNDDYIKNIYRASPLHDIGKITIPDRILQKESKLTSEEYEVMKTHAEAGGNIIMKSMTSLEEKDFVQVAFDMACYHHEKWDGTGYPKGLKGTDIPLSARILAVVDVFDALVSRRVYKDGMSLEEAYEIMLPDRGVAYEELLFDTFFEDKEELDAFRQSLC